MSLLLDCSGPCHSHSVLAYTKLHIRSSDASERCHEAWTSGSRPRNRNDNHVTRAGRAYPSYTILGNFFWDPKKQEPLIIRPPNFPPPRHSFLILTAGSFGWKRTYYTIYSYWVHSGPVTPGSGLTKL